MEKEIARLKRIANSRICGACLERHDIDVMCPPFEVRTRGQAWFRAELAERVRRIEELEAERREPVAIRQLRQLRRVTHHHDLISWEVCERLLHGGFVETSMGDYSCLTKAGVELCWALGLLDEKENTDAE